VFKCTNRVDGWVYAIKRTLRKARSVADLQVRCMTTVFRPFRLPNRPALPSDLGPLMIDDQKRF
jgi:hypothetical protein